MNFKRAAVVSIVGKQNIGKTTLISELIPKLKKDGHRVGTFKYNIRKLEIDHERKDTYKYFRSGADTVGISSHDQIAVIKRSEVVPRIEEILEKFFNDVTIVLIEGYRGEGVPKIKILDSLEFDESKKVTKNSELSLCMEGTIRGHFSDCDISKALHFIEKIISRDASYSKKNLQNV